MSHTPGLSKALVAVMKRYGDVPTFRRTIPSPRERVLTLRKLEGGLLGAAGLVWNSGGQVLLVREHAVAEGRVVWTTPGGMARPGEGPEEVFLREVREEAGVEAEILDLTCVYDLTVTDSEGEARGLFFQFEGLAPEPTTQPGEGILEARWFDELPMDMAFRDDYLSVVESRGSELARSGG